jgi:hypothetical protein
VQCDVDLDRRAAVVNHGRGNRRARLPHGRRNAAIAVPEPLVEKSVDKTRMNCAEVAISSTEKFKFAPFYCSGRRNSLPIFHPARESTGERQDFCEARLKA